MDDAFIKVHNESKKLGCDTQKQSNIEVTEEYSVIELKTEKESEGIFVRILDTKQGYGYGGNQAWYRSILNNPNMSNTGCGSIATANIIYYYAQNNDSERNLVEKLIPTKKEYTEFAASIYKDYVKQSIRFMGKSFGVWFFRTISKGFIKYSKRKGRSFKLHSINNGKKSFENAAEFIKKGLEGNNPVLLFVSFNKYAKELYEENITSQTHSVIVTRLIEKVKVIKRISETDEKEIISRETVDFALTISTWGERTEIPSFKELWNAKKAATLFERIAAFFASPFQRRNVYLAYYEF